MVKNGIETGKEATAARERAPQERVEGFAPDLGEMRLVRSEEEVQLRRGGQGIERMHRCQICSSERHPMSIEDDLEATE